MKKTLWILGGNIEAAPSIELAKSMGLHVVVSDGNPEAPGFRFADEHVVVSTYDVDATVAAAQKYHDSVRRIDGVICLACDVPHTVASVAAALNLPGIPVDIAFRMVDKVAMKDYFTQHRIPIPWYQEIKSVADLQAAVGERGFNLVIKPVDSRGARGVLLLKPGIDLAWAFQHAQSESPTQRVMIESYLTGPQISTESLIQSGIAYTLGFSDRNYEFLESLAPYIIENGGDIPSHIPEDEKHLVCELIQDVTAALGIKTGVIKGDIVVHNGKPYVIEVATRLSGGYFCSHEIPLNTGVDFVGHAIRLCLGESLSQKSLTPLFNRPVCQRYLFLRPGLVRSVQGLHEVAQRSAVHYCTVNVQAGDKVSAIANHTMRSGMIITSGQTIDEARHHAEAAIADIHVEIDCE